MKDFIIGTIAVAALLLGGFALVQKTAVTAPPNGAVTGPDVYAMTFFHDNVNVGGLDFATSSTGAVTYTAASIVKSRVIEHQAASAVTATLPTNAALSALGFLPNVGDTQVIFIHASTSAVTLVGSTGVQLNSASTTLLIGAGKTGRIEFVRYGATEGRLINGILTVGGL